MSNKLSSLSLSFLSRHFFGSCQLDVWIDYGEGTLKKRKKWNGMVAGQGQIYIGAAMVAATKKKRKRNSLSC
jgi:hypothetical protein